MLITAWGAGASSFAQSAAGGPEGAEKKFYIGYLIDGSDLSSANARMETLKQFLLGRADVRAALAQAGFNDRELVLSPCETPNNMAQRMTDLEFHLVFATAIVYAHQNGPAYNYEPILQFKLPGDIQPPNQDGVQRQGVIFVGPDSPLFAGKGSPTKEELRALLARAPLAVPSADSAAGYLSPRHIMTYDLGMQTILPALFCDSDSEVVKHVVSGMAEVGACREGALAELGLNKTPEKYYRILRKTDMLPTDPILLRSELMPMRSPLGVKLKGALREFFSKPELSVANASPRDFETIVGYLKEADLRAAANPPAGAAAPAPAVTPNPPVTPAPALPATPTPPAAATPTPTPPPAARPAPSPAAPTPPAAKPPAATPAPKPALPGSVPPDAAPRPALPPMAAAVKPAALASPTPAALRPALPPQATPLALATPSAPQPAARPAPHPALPPMPPAATPISRPALPGAALPGAALPGAAAPGGADKGVS